MASRDTRRCVAMQAAPVAPAAPLLEVAGNGKLRVRFAAPPAEPACSEMAVYLRTIGAGVPCDDDPGASLATSHRAASDYVPGSKPISPARKQDKTASQADVEVPTASL